MIENPPAKRAVDLKYLQAHLSELLDRVSRHEENLVIEKKGTPVAAVISVDEFEQYRRMLATLQHAELARLLGAEADRKGLTEDELHRELRETRQQVFRERYGDLSR